MALGDLAPSSAFAEIEALETEITTLSAQLSAATYRLLELIAEFDRREGWGGWGIKSCAHWLTWKCGIGIVAAREKVRVARALEKQPGIADAMRRGVLSYSKVRAMTRIATPANEPALLAIALNGTASHVERVSQLYRRTGRAVESEVAAAQHRDRELSYYVDEDGSFVFRGRLPPDQGALVMKALEAADAALRADAVEDKNASAEAARLSQPASWAERQADALTLMAETVLAHGPRGLAAGDRHLVTVHVNVKALASAAKSPEEAAEAALEADDIQCHLHDGPALARDVVRRFACDASVVALLENERGEVLDVGRKTRAIPPALRRALDHRDQRCRFPGCLCTRFVDAHHIEHWAEGGATRLDNLVLLCRRHHVLVHEGGFSLAVENGEVVVRRPDGRVVEQAPAIRALREDGRAAIQRKHEALGICIDARTGIPGWGGERADYDYLIGLVQQRDLHDQSVPTALGD